MKAGAVPLWSYYCAPRTINDLLATLTFDTAYDPGSWLGSVFHA